MVCPVPVVVGSDGVREEQPPVDAAIPDYRELQLANAGFIALVSKKDQLDEACFFSAQSAKLGKATLLTCCRHRTLTS